VWCSGGPRRPAGRAGDRTGDDGHRSEAEEPAVGRRESMQMPVPTVIRLVRPRTLDARAGLLGGDGVVDRSGQGLGLRHAGELTGEQEKP